MSRGPKWSVSKGLSNEDIVTQGQDAGSYYMVSKKQYSELYDMVSKGQDAELCGHSEWW